jgi:type IV pilus assembly protein PilB
LVRVICGKCKQPFEPSPAQLEVAGITPEQVKGAKFLKGAGCGSCQGSGYRGRLGIFELMVMSAKMRELTFQGANMQDIRKAAVSEGMNTLYADGINKVLNGITTLDEVFRVSKKEVESAA